MIRLVKYEEKYREAVAKIDESLAEGISIEPNVPDESKVVVLSGKRVIGAGFLKKGATLLAAEQGLPFPEDPPMSPLHICFYADFKALPGDPEEVDASAAILEDFEDKLLSYREDHPDVPAAVSIFSNEKREAYGEFLQMMGFEEADRMHTYERDLSEIKDDAGTADNSIRSGICHLRNGDSYSIGFLDVSDSSKLASYVRTNGEAFGVPDSAEDLLFRVEHWDARVLAAVKEDGEVMAAVSLWKNGDHGATEDVFCSPEFRRQGVTMRLLNAAAVVLKSEGCRTAGLNVYENDLPAVQLYEKLGYRKKGTLIEYHFSGIMA